MLTNISHEVNIL